MEKLLKGKPVADAIDEGLIAKMPVFYEKGVVPTLADFLLGTALSRRAQRKVALKF